MGKESFDGKRGSINHLLGCLRHELLQGWLKIEVEALEKFSVVRTTPRKQFLGRKLGSLVLKRAPFRRASLRNLIFEPSLLSLQQTTVFAIQIGRVTDQQLWDNCSIVLGSLILIIIIAAEGMRATMWRCPSKFAMLQSFYLLLIIRLTRMSTYW